MTSPDPLPADPGQIPLSAGRHSLFARAMRSSAWVVFGYAGSQALRLGSNLILTRLLFPEAFGLMALVSVFLIGLTLFSDVGIAPAIMQNKRGDDPDFLNTAFTIQALRGLGLWLATCAIALPVSQFYGDPLLAQLLPVGGLSLLVAGFFPTRIETAHRHLLLGQVMRLDLLSQALGMLAMILIAAVFQSIWGLVIGGVIGSLAKLGLTTWLLPGQANRFRWEARAAQELIHFGKWIFLSTGCSFLLLQGDKAILGKYLTLDQLGIYNIGYFLASFPIYLGAAVIGRVLIPVYRSSADTALPEMRRKIARMRFGLTGSLMAMLLMLAFAGPALVHLMYDPRYAMAGGILTLIACMMLPVVIGMSYDQAALAAGESRRYFYLTATRALVQTGFFLIGAQYGGLVGALMGQGLSAVVVYPVIVWLARRHGAWDPLHDVVFGLAGLGFGGAALWLGRPAIAALSVM